MSYGGELVNDAPLDLHPAATQGEANVTVNRFELESLYKINQINAGEKQVLQEEIERLQQTIRQQRCEKREENEKSQDTIRELRRDIQSLSTNLFNERQKNAWLQQQNAMLDCQFRSLDGQLAEARQREIVREEKEKCEREKTKKIARGNAERSRNFSVEPVLAHRHAQRSPGPINHGMLGGRGIPETGHLAQGAVGFAERGPASCEDLGGEEGGAVIVQELAEQADRYARENVDNNFSTLGYLLGAVRDEVGRLQEDMRHIVGRASAEESQYQAQKAEAENKLRKLEALYDVLQGEKLALEKQNQQLITKLRILEGHEEGRIVLGTSVRKSGRFMVKSLSLECSRCHQTFTSVEEMENSVCIYHSANPVPFVEEESKFWPCCRKKGTKVPVGCTRGMHVLTKKRVRLEE